MLTEFQSVCSNFAVPLAEDKTVHPTTCLTFLGIEMDSEKMVMRLPKEKLIKTKEQIRSFIFKKYNSKRNAITAWSTQIRM